MLPKNGSKYRQLKKADNFCFSDNVDLDSAEVRNHLETLVESLIGEGLDDSSILKPNKSNVPQAGEVTIYSSIYIFFNGYLQVFLSI